MKAIHVISGFGAPDTCYTYCNMYQTISEKIGGDLWSFNQNTVDDVFDNTITHLIFEDFNSLLPERELLTTLDKIKKKSPNISIIACPYDPPNFPLIDVASKESLIDKVVVFDKKFSNRFDIPTLVSDNILNERMFATERVEKNKDICYYGHLELGRELPPNIDHVRENRIFSLYRKVACYKRGIVFDSGVDEDRNPGISYNKVKAIEMLMCGVRPYVKNGIDYDNYNEFFRPFECYQEKEERDPIDISEIKEINRVVVERFVKFLIGDLHYAKI